jgi:hypothetical protein
MGLLRKVAAVNTLGLVKPTSKKERADKHASRNIAKQTELLEELVKQQKKGKK